MAFYNNGERKTRPGVYIRVTNRANGIFAPATTDPVDPGPDPGPGSTKIMLLKDSRGVLLKTSDGYYLAVKN